ncbi:MAG: helix-turn-helix domain-containing protein [Lentisphaerae bacterium]|nr:helix-turn-helix domain-containing protein [Lentisphaerota bacterium]
MPNNVEFFNWKLNAANPVTVMNISYGKLKNIRRPDIHSAIHLGLVIQGENCGRFGRDELRLTAGDVYLTSPWEPHQTTESSGANLLLITLDARSLEEFFSNFKENLSVLLRMPPSARMEYINSRKIESAEKLLWFAGKEPPSPLEKLRLWHTVLEFFMEILPEQTGDLPANDDYRKVLPVLEKLGNKMITLEEGARLCNLSASRFSVLFKNFSGLSFGRYERNFRLNGAAGAIRRGATLKEAAAEWDFCDKSHLARLLKEF